MADERAVAKKLEQIEQYHGEPKAKQQSLSREDLFTDTTEQRAVERMFENAIQACSDLAQHVATHDFDFQDDASKEAIRLLGQEEVIDEKTMNTLISLFAWLVPSSYTAGRRTVNHGTHTRGFRRRSIIGRV
jgi:uncharacterized protein YutE (UPF0331/DUF86 family)